MSPHLQQRTICQALQQALQHLQASVFKPLVLAMALVTLVKYVCKLVFTTQKLYVYVNGNVDPSVKADMWRGYGA